MKKSLIFDVVGLRLSIVVIVTLVLLAGCGEVPASPLRVGTIPWPGYESLHLAQSLGYFNASQVRLVELTSVSQNSKNLRNGSVDAALLTLDETLTLMQEGADLRVVLMMDFSNGADVVLAKPEIATFQDLRGKRIGVETSGIGAIMFDALLTAASLNVSDVNVIDMPVNEHVSAYQSGKIDAVVTFEPSRTTLLNQSAHILFDSSRIPGRIVDVLVVRTEAMTTHAEAIRALIAAHFKALDYLARQPQDTAARLAPFLGVTPEQVLPQFNGIKLPDLAENRTQMSGPGAPLTQTAAKLADFMLHRQLLHSAVKVERLVEPKFLPKALP